MNARPVLALAAALLLSGCGVRSQSKPEKIDTPASSPTPTPTIQRSACPSTTPPTPIATRPSAQPTTPANCAPEPGSRPTTPHTPS